MGPFTVVNLCTLLMKSKDSVIFNFFTPSFKSQYIYMGWFMNWATKLRKKIHQTHHCNYHQMSGVWGTNKTTFSGSPDVQWAVHDRALAPCETHQNHQNHESQQFPEMSLGDGTLELFERLGNLIQETPLVFQHLEPSSSGAGWTKWSLSLQAMISSQSTTRLISGDINLTRFTATQSLCKQASKILSLTWIARVT